MHRAGRSANPQVARPTTFWTWCTDRAGCASKMTKENDYREQFEDVTVKPGEVIGPGDTELDFEEVSHLVQVPATPSALGRRTRRILSRYAILLVWGVMALFFYCVRPDTFGRLSAFQ